MPKLRCEAKYMDEVHSPDTKAFNEILDTFGWHQHVEDSTHLSGHTIDLCVYLPPQVNY